METFFLIMGALICVLTIQVVGVINAKKRLRKTKNLFKNGNYSRNSKQA